MAVAKIMIDSNNTVISVYCPTCDGKLSLLCKYCNGTGQDNNSRLRGMTLVNSMVYSREPNE